jgi:hypothetical protein
MGASGSNPSAMYASGASGSYPSSSFVSPPSASSIELPLDGDPTLAQAPPPASVPPPGHASVTRVATITDASVRSTAGGAGGAKTWLYAIGAAALVGGGIGAAWVVLGQRADANRGDKSASSVVGSTATTPPTATTATADSPSSSSPVVVESAEPVASVSASGAPTSRVRTPPVRTAVAPPPSSASTGDESGTGTLTVTANPWGNVTVDGKSYGSTPLPGISLPSGPHTVVVSNPELGSTRSATVKIKAGQSQGVRFDFKKTD